MRLGGREGGMRTHEEDGVGGRRSMGDSMLRQAKPMGELGLGPPKSIAPLPAVI